MLIDFFGEEICFTYPKDRKKSQMFFSTNVTTGDVIETLRTNESMKMCAGVLRKECEEFDFDLDGTYKNANDLRIAFENFDQKRPPMWEKFFNILFPFRKSSDNITRKCDMIFQEIYNIMEENGHPYLLE